MMRFVRAVIGSCVVAASMCAGFVTPLPAHAAPAITITTVDSDNPDIVGSFTSLVLDGAENPVISYYDVTNGDLELVHCGDTTCSSGNQIRTVDVSLGADALGTSLALDGSGNPVISYQDAVNDDLKVAHCGDATCSSGNQITTVDSTGDVGALSSLALDDAGNPVISYDDATNEGLKVAHCGNTTCSSANQITTVDGALGPDGFGTSLALDGDGDPVIGYYDATNEDLKVAHCGDTTCSSGNQITTVDSTGDVGKLPSLALDGAGNPVISYYDSTNGDLKLTRCGDANCSSGNQITTVDGTGDVGQYSSLALDTAGNPVISYWDSTVFFNETLKLAQCGNPTCSAGNTLTTVDPGGASMTVGSFTSLALDGAGNPAISYHSFDSGLNSALKLAVVQSPMVDRAGVSLSRFGYANPSGFTGTQTVDITSGDLDVVRGSDGTVHAIYGAVTVPGNPGPGVAQIGVSMNRFWLTNVYVGRVNVRDLSAGVSVSTPILFRPLVPVGNNGVRGFASWFAFTPPFSFSSYRLTFAFIDNA